MLPKITVTRYPDDRTVAVAVLNPEDPETVHADGSKHTQKTITRAPTLRKDEAAWSTSQKSNWVKSHEANRKVIDKASKHPLMWCHDCVANWVEKEFVFDGPQYTDMADEDIQQLVTDQLG